MKKERGLLQRMTPFLFLAVGIPIALFATLAQYRLQHSLSQSLEERIEDNLHHVDQHIDMVLDKYNTLLNDLSSNETMVSLVEVINENWDKSDIERKEIEEELARICGRNKDVVGISIFTSNNKVIYYDQLSQSSQNSTWAETVGIAVTGQETIYQGVTTPIVIGQDETYSFRLARKLLDNQSTQGSVGTVVLTFNEMVLKGALKSGDVPNYLYQNGVVISAADSKDIGKAKADVEAGNKQVNTIKNMKCGLEIANCQPLEHFSRTMTEQATFWILITIATMGITMALNYAIAKPYLKEIDSMAEAIHEVHQGNFKVQLPVKQNMSSEIQRINKGFNDMTTHIEGLIGQVKEAVLEQRSAELSALEAQIDPHFLYNTLDTINWKAIEKGEFEISEMLGALADILRYTVKNAGDETTVEQELYWLHQYIRLKSTKARKDLNVVMNVPDELKGCKIHKLLLQPFVENAIKHGIRHKSGQCKIEVIMRNTDGQLHIIVKDNGCGIDVDTKEMLNGYSDDHTEYEKNHLGIINVRKRLNLYYGEQTNLYFESEIGLYTKVHLFIPMIV